MEKKVSKRIRFDYFRVALASNPETIIDITPMLEYFETLPDENRIMGYVNGNIVRILNIKLHERYTYELSKTVRTLNFPIWQVTFTRSRPDLPGVLHKKAKELVPLELEDDEYISEDTVMIYDPQKRVAVIQRNLTGTPPKAIQTMLNEIITEEDQKIELQPLFDELAYKRAKGQFYHRAMHFRVTNVRSPQIDVDETSAVKNIIASAASYADVAEYPIQLEMILKIPGVVKGKSLSDPKYRDTIKELKQLSDQKLVDRLLVKGATDEAAQIEEIDLIEEIIRDWINFSISENRFIATITVFEKLIQSYAKKRPVFIDIKEEAVSMIQ